MTPKRSLSTAGMYIPCFRAIFLIQGSYQIGVTEWAAKNAIPSNTVVVKILGNLRGAFLLKYNIVDKRGAIATLVCEVIRRTYCMIQMYYLVKTISASKEFRYWNSLKVPLFKSCILI
jgi:hypothetical protein